MSAFVTGLTLKFLPVEDHIQLLVALTLADQADDFGENVFPSVSLVATSARIAERTVQYAMRDLETLGYLVLVKRGGGRSTPSRYRIDVDWLMTQVDRYKLLRDKKSAKYQTDRNGAQRAPFSRETCDDISPMDNSSHKGRTKGANTAQKGRTNGAQVAAPDPYPNSNPKTPTPYPQSGGGGKVSELQEPTTKAEPEFEEMMRAAVWTQLQAGRKIESPGGFETYLRTRYANGFSSADLADLDKYRKAMASAQITAQRIAIAHAPPPLDPTTCAIGDAFRKQIDKNRRARPSA